VEVVEIVGEDVAHVYFVVGRNDQVQTRRVECHRSALVVELLLYFQGAGAIVPDVYCLVIAAGNNELFPDADIKTSDLCGEIRHKGLVELARHVVEFSLNWVLCVLSNINVGLKKLALVSHHVDRVFF